MNQEAKCGLREESWGPAVGFGARRCHVLGNELIGPSQLWPLGALAVPERLQSASKAGTCL